jgi:peptidoglycan/LPS O-acetylase OafA/YrhL
MTAPRHSRLSERAQSDVAITAEDLGHVPALDGIRSIAVAAVLVFHGGIAGTQGGFLGVSVFFTLSGFLITSLLLRQWADRSTIDLKAFWVRRFRRLLPASWLTMGLVVVMGLAGVWDTEQLRSLRGDIPWALVELLNWRFIAAGTAYGDEFNPPSPLEHYWSLAIEQQFYVVLPLLVLAALAAGRRLSPARPLAALVAALAMMGAASLVLNGYLAGLSADRSYFGTDSRAAELLIGALLACATLRRLRLRAGPARVASIALGMGALVVLIALFGVAELRSEWLYPWGFLLTAGCTTTLIFGALQGGWLGRLLSAQPLPAIGRISYGVYLLHWPIFMWLTPARVGWPTIPLFAVRLAVTFLLAAAMFLLIERPISSGRAVRGRAAVPVLAIAAAALLLGNFVITRDLGPPPSFLQPAEEGELDIREAPGVTTTSTQAETTTTAEVTTVPPTVPPTTVPAVPPRRVLMVGDSIAASLDAALGEALNARGISFAAAVAPGCGVVTGDPADERGKAFDITTACSGAIPPLQRDAVEAVQPDLVVVLSSWEGSDRIVDGTWYQFGSPEGNAVLSRLYDETVGRLTATGAAVAVTTLPENVEGQVRSPDPDTIRRGRILNQFLTEFAAARDRIATLSLDSIVCPTTPCPTVVDGIRLRPRDGAHFDTAEGARYAAERLADQIAALNLADLGRG